MCGFGGDGRMPGDEVGEGFDFAGRFEDLEATDATGELCETAWNGENQIRVGSGVNGGHEEGKGENDAALGAESGERAIHKSLLTCQGFNLNVGKLKILFKGEAAAANRLSRAYKTYKFQAEQDFTL